MGTYGSHAVVVGASMGGLVAARALLGPYDHVTVLDRDDLPADARHRKGVPQGRQVHLLQPRGAQILSSMFPGLLGELEAAGAPTLRRYEEAMVSFGGRFLAMPDGDAELTTYQPSRPLLESTVRARLRTLPGVEIVAHCEATGLRSNAGRVTGVAIQRDGQGGELAADLVVDATGRSGRAPVWLAQLGYDPAPEESLAIDLKYATRVVRMPRSLGPVRFVGIAPRADTSRSLAVEEIEGDRLMITPVGYGGDHPPTDDAGFDAYLTGVAPPWLASILLGAEPLGDVVAHRYPSNLRRRYEKLDSFPAGFLVFGDAVCSFNPLYAQGMTVAAMQAEALRACLLGGRGDADLARRFFARAARAADVAWQLAIGGDLAVPDVPGPRTPADRAGIAYVRRIQAAASVDPVVSETFMRVAFFLLPPAALFRPDFVRRVLHGARAAAPPSLELTNRQVTSPAR